MILAAFCCRFATSPAARWCSELGRVFDPVLTCIAPRRTPNAAAAFEKSVCVRPDALEGQGLEAIEAHG